MNITHLCDLTYYNPIGLKIAEYTINTEILLKYAIKENNYIVCKNLLNNIKELKSNLIFSYAVEQNNNTIIQLLLDYIYDNNILDEKDDFNDTPLNKAAWNGNLELCKFLVYNNVNIQGYNNIPDKYGNTNKNSTPLYCAVKSNNYKQNKLGSLPPFERSKIIIILKCFLYQNQHLNLYKKNMLT